MRSTDNAPDDSGIYSNTTSTVVCPGCGEPLRQDQLGWQDGALVCGGCGCELSLVVADGSNPSSQSATVEFREPQTQPDEDRAQTIGLRVLSEEDRPPTTMPSSSEAESDEDDVEDSSTVEVYPDERHYPTLEAMQRLHKLFGYTAVLLVFLYLSLRLVLLVASETPNLAEELILLSQTAVILTFATVVVTGTLFTLAEGIKLAIDLQNNTLRIANRNGRRKRK